MIKTEVCIKCGRTLYYDPSSGEMLPKFTKKYGHMCTIDGKHCKFGMPHNKKRPTIVRRQAGDSISGAVRGVI